MIFKPKGVCCKEISFDVIDNKVTKVSFTNGCPGNLIGISQLIEGMDINDAISRLKGINCRDKGTSCPDQLAIALEEYKRNNL